jgi:hypothetical protein
MRYAIRRAALLLFAALVITGPSAWPQGNPLGPEFRVNTYTTGRQWNPTVAADPSGGFVVIWGSRTQDGSNWGVYGQRYGQIVPVELLRFGVE